MGIFLTQSLISARLYAFEIGHAVLFDGSTGYFSRVAGTADSRKKFTFYFTVARNAFGAEKTILSAVSGGKLLLRWTSGNKLHARISQSGTEYARETDAVFRDTAFGIFAWVVDTSQPTASNRNRLYQCRHGDGWAELSTTGSDIPQNADVQGIGDGSSIQYIGVAYSGGPLQHLPDWIAQPVMLDGAADVPINGVFADVSDNGNPKFVDPSSLSFGSEGWWLNFSNADALGEDSSGNGNNWTGTNISSSNRVTSTPTNTYAKWNPLHSGLDVTLLNGNKTMKPIPATSGTARWASTLTLPMKSVPIYLEFDVTTLSPGEITHFGLHHLSYSNAILDGSGPYIDAHGPLSGGYAWHIDYVGTKAYYVNGSSDSTDHGGAISSGDRLRMAYDPSTGKLWFGAPSGWNDGGNPETGVNPSMTVMDTARQEMQIFGMTNIGVSLGSEITVYTDPNEWNYSAPSGFEALSTNNLLANSTLNLSDHFKTVLYNTNGGTLEVGTGLPTTDVVWAKLRSYNNVPEIYDSLRGAEQRLQTSSTAAENTESNSVTALGTDSFTLGSNIGLNYAGQTGVAWCFSLPSDENNADGDITVTWKYNATLGMAVGTYTGSGNAGDTLGLPNINGKAPSMAIIKNRDALDSWQVYHKSIGATGRVELNSTGGVITSPAYWNDTVPTSSVLTLGNAGDLNTSGERFVIYVFWETELCKIGSYAGNGNADGPFVNTGGMPVWWLGKRTDSADNWWIYDNERSVSNPVQHRLIPDTDGAEAESASWAVDHVSNGYKVRNTNVQFNASGGTYIYLAFVQPNGPTENPGR